jgi:hypothetical protein
MGLFSKAVKAGLAKRVIDEASKPHNQRKIKQFISSVTGGGKGQAPGGGRPRGR